jgi:uroporphyrinogen decarboxylase
MSTMTPRQRVITALNREVPDCVPFELSYGSFTPALMDRFVAETGAEDPAEYWNYPVRSVMHRPAPAFKLWRTYASYYPEQLQPGATISPFGVVRTLGSTEHFTRQIHPLRRATRVEEAADYPLPDPLNPARYAHLKRAVAALHAQELAVQGELYTTIFETAWSLRGFEETLADIALNHGIIETLFDRLTTLRVIEARQLAEAGVDVLRLGDDVSGQTGMLMSPATWRRWLKPRLAQIIDAARSIKPDTHIFYHCDGDCRAIIPELIEIGVTVLNPVQPECMDAALLKEAFGDKLAFWGTIGTQTTMPFATPEEVRSVVKARIETVGRGGGLLLAPTHVLEPDVPWRNIVAFVDAVKEYGSAPPIQRQL